MINIQKTVHYIKGAITNPEKIWSEYSEENPDWKETAVNITIPLAVISAILSYIFSLVFGHHGMYSGSLRFFIFGMIFSIIGYFIFSAVISYLAGYFKGENNFCRALASVSLASVPAAIGSPLGTLPFIGAILSILISIYSLVLLYRNIPIFLKVPQETRTKHFIITLVISFVIGFILSFILDLFFWGGNYHIHEQNFE